MRRHLNPTPIHELAPMASPKRTLAFLLAALVWMPAAAQQARPPTQLSFDRIFDETAQTDPQQIGWAPDGRRLSYLWQDERGKALWLLDVETGERARILSVGDSGEEGLPRLAELADHHWSPTGEEVLLESGGDLYRLTLADGALSRLTETGAEEKTPRFSPDGSKVAFVRDWDLHLLDLGNGREMPLTEGGVENELLNAITDWVYWEEIWDRTATGFWWSPDGARIAYYQFDEREVRSYPMVDFLPGYPEVVWQKYPKAGETNPRVRIGVLEIATRETTWLETGTDPNVYLARIDWLPAAKRVAIQRLNRDQDRLDLMSCDAASGSCRTLLTETSATWVNLTGDLRFLDDGSFLWTSEASGWRRLALHDPEGRPVRTLSPEASNVTEVNGLAGGVAFFTAHEVAGLGALHRTAFAQPLDGGAPTPLTPAASWGSVRISPDGRRYVRSWSRAHSPTRTEVAERGNEATLPLPTAARAGIVADSLPKPRFLTIPGPDGVRLPAMLTTPPDLDSQGSYPAVMYHYGGPASQVVADRWSWRARALWHAMMAERGYVVLRVDNRASNFFGKHGHDRAHRRFGPENLAAQRAGVGYLGSLGYVDTGRIGIWGGSGGGYHTLYALLNSPGTWRAGVAFAPVTDFRFYDTIWTERYLDHPEDNPDGYRDSAPTSYAANLRDHLLIVHGTGDDNVHPQNTLVMAHKLVAAGRPFEMSLHPRQKHGFRGADLRHFYERMTEFFDRHLGAAD